VATSRCGRQIARPGSCYPAHARHLIAHTNRLCTCPTEVTARGSEAKVVASNSCGNLHVRSAHSRELPQWPKSGPGTSQWQRVVAPPEPPFAGQLAECFRRVDICRWRAAVSVHRLTFPIKLSAHVLADHRSASVATCGGLR
jgi:hypothetical protein